MKSVLNIHWKDWCWRWGLILKPPDAKSWLIGKGPDAGKIWGQKEKGATEDEMVGWHHQLNGHEFEQTSGDGEGQGSLACCSPWGRKESDKTEWLNDNQCICSVVSESSCPMDCSPPGSSLHEIFQARILDCGAISYSRGSSRSRDQTQVSCVSCIGRWILYCWHPLGSQEFIGVLNT